MTNIPADPAPDMEPRTVAAMWLAKMQRPDAERYRSDLDAWLAADPANLAAYNKAAGRFHDAKMLSRSTRWQPAPVNSPGHRKQWALVAVVALVLGAAWPLWKMLSPSAIIETNSRQTDAVDAIVASATIDNQRGAISRRRLPDGSFVSLDTQSEMRFAFNPKGRDIWLDAGRARFSVAHDRRPFIVHAGTGTVTATGTVFDVAVAPSGTVQVRLLEGGVDVQPSIARPMPPRKLKAGQALTFTRIDHAVPIAAIDPRDIEWVDGMMAFESTPLSEIVAIANRYGRAPIRIEGSGLPDMRLSGRFRIDNPDRLAANLAQSLDLTVEHQPSGAIILRR